VPQPGFWNHVLAVSSRLAGGGREGFFFLAFWLRDGNAIQSG
jgi:hypothetical protein